MVIVAKACQRHAYDVVVTSPPYNIGAKYGTSDDNLEHNEYLNWIESVGVTVKKVLKDEGSFFINVGSKPRQSEVGNVRRESNWLVGSL